jgi:hypothetical protein
MISSLLKTSAALLLASLASPVAAQPLSPTAPGLPTDSFQLPSAEPGAPAAVAAKPKPKPKPKPKRIALPPAPRETTINADDTRPTYTADTLPNTALASERYLEIARAGGWPLGAEGPRAEGGGEGAGRGHPQAQARDHRRL